MKKLFLLACLSILAFIFSCQTHPPKITEDDSTDLPKTTTRINNAVLASWFDAVERSDVDTITSMLKEGFNIDAVGARAEGFDYEFTALMLAASFGDSALVNFFINSRANINAKTLRGSALLMATANGHEDIVRLLISKKANVNITAVDGRTALMAAASEGDSVIVEMLLKAGADKTMKHSSGRTALDYAMSGKYTSVVKLLNEA